MNAGSLQNTTLIQASAREGALGFLNECSDTKQRTANNTYDIFIPGLTTHAAIPGLQKLDSLLGSTPNSPPFSLCAKHRGSQISYVSRWRGENIGQRPLHGCHLHFTERYLIILRSEGTVPS